LLKGIDYEEEKDLERRVKELAKKLGVKPNLNRISESSFLSFFFPKSFQAS